MKLEPVTLRLCPVTTATGSLSSGVMLVLRLVPALLQLASSTSALA